MAQTKRPRRRRRPQSRGTGPGGPWRAIRVVLSLAVWGFVALVGLVAWYAYDLPDIARLEEAIDVYGMELPVIGLTELLAEYLEPEGDGKPAKAAEA